MTDRATVTSVLVADDHPAVVEAVADVLSEHGIEIAGGRATATTPSSRSS